MLVILFVNRNTTQVLCIGVAKLKRTQSPFLLLHPCSFGDGKQQLEWNPVLALGIGCWHRTSNLREELGNEKQRNTALLYCEGITLGPQG